MASTDRLQLATSRRFAVTRAIAPDLDMTPGSQFRSQSDSGAALSAMVLYTLDNYAQQSSIQNAVGNQLDLYAADAGITPRVKAKASTTYIQVLGGANSPLGGFPVQQGTQTFTSPDSSGNVIFFTTDTLTYVQTGQTVNINVTASTPGSGSNISAGALVNMQPVPGVTLITNPNGTSNGTDAESDTTLRARILQSKTVFGTAQAIIGEAKTVVGVAQGAVNDPKNGTVNSATLYIAQSDGTCPASLITAVQNVMPNVLPITFSITVTNLDLVYNAMAITISLAPGTDSSTAQSQVIAAVQNYVTSLPPGQTIQRYLLAQAITNNVPGLVEFFISSTLPTVTTYQLFRFLAPPAAPTTGQSAASTTIAANTYYSALAWTTAAGDTLVSQTTQVVIATSNNLQIDVTVPTLPLHVTGAKIFLGTSPSSLALQSSGAAAGVTHLTSYNSAGASPATINTVSQPTITVV